MIRITYEAAYCRLTWSQPAASQPAKRHRRVVRVGLMSGGSHLLDLHRERFAFLGNERGRAFRRAVAIANAQHPRGVSTRPDLRMVRLTPLFVYRPGHRRKNDGELPMVYKSSIRSFSVASFHAAWNCCSTNTASLSRCCAIKLSHRPKSSRPSRGRFSIAARKMDSASLACPSRSNAAPSDSRTG